MSRPGFFWQAQLPARLWTSGFQFGMRAAGAHPRETILRKAILLAGVMLMAVPGLSEAHVDISPPEAGPGMSFMLTFGLGHGCEGAPTIGLRIQVPTGIVSVQPVVKPGWQIETVTGPYDAPQLVRGVEVTEGVVEVRWRGGALPNELYDQFLIRARIADGVEPGTMLWFPVIQDCPGGAASRWITVPVAGQPEPDEPAPGILVTEPTGSGAH